MRDLRGISILGLGVVCVALAACRPTETGCASEGCPADATCNTVSGQCEPLSQCTSNADCALGEACLGGTCSSCTTNVRCTTDLTTCDPAKLDCGRCAGDADCGGAFPLCGNSGCSACRTDADCGGSTPRCAYRWCVQCESDGDCPSGTLCKAGTCAASCADNDTSNCGPSTPFCSGRVCLQCRTEQDCPTGEACYEGTCRAVLAGDTCRNAIDLPLPGGSAVVKGQIGSAYRADTSFPEVLWEVDAFYRITLTEETALNAELSLSGMMPEGEVRLYRGECGKLFPLASGARAAKDIVVMPGTYYVAVHIQPQGSGPYTLRVYTSPGSRAVGNHCDKSQPLAVGSPGGSTVTVQGTTAGLSPVIPDFCDEAFTPLPDAVYSFELQERSHVELLLTPLEPSTDLTLAVVQDCYTSQSSCGGSSAPGRPRSWANGPLEPGRYFVHVRTQAAPGPFELTATVNPWATNGTCEAALPLTFVDGVLSTSGDVRYTDSGYLGCSTYSKGRRLNYTFSTRGLGDRSMLLELTGEEGMAPPVAFISTACLSEGDTGTACTSYPSHPQPPGRIEVPFLPEGDYFLQVGETSGAGRFSLRAVLGPPYPLPANDTCSGAEVLSLASNTFQVDGDTRGALDQHSARCNGEYSQEEGRDVVYRVPISGKGRLEAVLLPTSPEFDATLHMELGCSTSSFTCSNTQGAGGEERMARRFHDAYDYDAFLWVDGEGGTEGTFTLSGRWIPAPAHDTCAGAQAVTAGQSVTGTLEAAFNDSGGPCSRSSVVPDLFYTFTASSNGTATVSLTPSGFDGVLSVQTPCSTPVWEDVCQGVANAGGLDVAETLSFPVQRNTQYVMVVSGATAESDGTFSLSVAIQ